MLYRWRGVPTHKNMGGAVERPTAEHVWGRISVALEASGGEADAPLDSDPPLDRRGVPWPLFASLLVANGGFTRVQGFQSPAQIKGAVLRLVAFLALWVAAFAFLPGWLVGAALAAWIVFIAPKGPVGRAGVPGRERFADARELTLARTSQSDPETGRL